MSRPVSWFLLAFGVWSWVIWPTFLSNIAADPRSWAPAGGPTGFFLVHLVLTIVSIILGTIMGVLGIRGLIAIYRKPKAAEPEQPVPATRD